MHPENFLPRIVFDGLGRFKSFSRTAAGFAEPYAGYIVFVVILYLK
jgi:hypothetical protein